MNFFKYLSIILWTLCGTGLAWYYLSFASTMTYVTLADGRKQERKLPALFKALLPFTPNLQPITRLTCFKNSIAVADRTLIATGFQGLLSGEEFIALKILIPLIGTCLWGSFLQLIFILFDSVLSREAFMPVLFGGFLFLWYYPLAWLRATLKTRHAAILKALPFTLDLLTLSVEAGMDFMSALQWICNRGKLDPLNEELIYTVREIQVGRGRKAALANLGERVNLQQLRAFCIALVQADDLGVGLSVILRIQSEQVRQQRFERAEQLANQAPTKMLFPLLLFIFPATLIILLGPIISRALQSVL